MMEFPTGVTIDNGTYTLRELNSTIQVAIGREGIHLYQFCL